MNIIDKISSKNISLLGVLFIIAIIVFAGILGYQILRKRKDKTSKTGFLGKPLYQLSLLFVLLSMFVGIAYFLESDVQLLSEAEKEVTIEMSFNKISEDAESATVQLKTIPYVKGEAWGDNQNFDVYWNIKPDDETQLKGQDEVDKFETLKNKNAPSSILIGLKKGTYKVRIIVVLDDESFETVKDLTID